MPQRVGRAHDLGQPLLALAVTIGAGEALALRPPSVAVHDHGDVFGEWRPRRHQAPAPRPHRAGGER